MRKSGLSSVDRSASVTIADQRREQQDDAEQDEARVVAERPARGGAAGGATGVAGARGSRLDGRRRLTRVAGGDRHAVTGGT